MVDGTRNMAVAFSVLCSKILFFKGSAETVQRQDPFSVEPPLGLFMSSEVPNIKPRSSPSGRLHSR